MQRSYAIRANLHTKHPVHRGTAGKYRCRMARYGGRSSLHPVGANTCSATLVGHLVPPPRGWMLDSASRSGRKPQPTNPSSGPHGESQDCLEQIAGRQDKTMLLCDADAEQGSGADVTGFTISEGPGVGPEPPLEGPVPAG